MSEGGVKGVPEGASVVTPRLFCRDVGAEIDFCKNTFGAVERVRRSGLDGAVAHALMTIGPAMIMIEAEGPGLASRAPKPDGSSPGASYVYLEDWEQRGERAVAGGGGGGESVRGGGGFWGGVVGRAGRPRRSIAECIAMLPEDSSATIDEDFARDVEEAVAAHREPLNPPAWD